MSSPSRFRSGLLLLLVLTFLVARISGVHLHLCLDGSEPFASVHVLDEGAGEPAAGLSATHHDEEIFPFGDLVSKTKVEIDPAAVAVALLLLWVLLQLPRLVTPQLRPAPARARVRAYLPPSRAPPRR